LLIALIEQAHKAEDDEAWNLLYFTARCLDFMVPSPRVTRKITTACIERCIAFGIEQLEKEKDPERESPSFEFHPPEATIRSLFNAAAENQATITDSFKNLLVDKINSGSEIEAFISLDLVLSAEEFYLFNSEKIQPPNQMFIDHIFEVCNDRINELRKKHFMIGLEAFWREEVSLADFIKWYGAEGIFREGYYNRFEQGLTLEGAASKSLMHSILMVPYLSEPSTLSLLEDLREVGGFLLSCSMPWLSGEQSTLGFYINWDWEEDQNELSKRESIRKQLSQDSNALFGAFALLAVVFEGMEEEEEEEEYFDQVHKSKAPLFDFMRWIFLARPEKREIDTDKVQSEMDRCGFSTEQQDFVWRWVRREINLVEKAVDEETVEV
jgi:hypothetical protein